MPFLSSKFSNCFLFHKNQKVTLSYWPERHLNHLTSFHSPLSNCSVSPLASHMGLSPDHKARSLIPTPGPLFLLILLPGISLTQRTIVFFFISFKSLHENHLLAKTSLSFPLKIESPPPEFTCLLFYSP